MSKMQPTPWKPDVATISRQAACLVPGVRRLAEMFNRGVPDGPSSPCTERSLIQAFSANGLTPMVTSTVLEGKGGPEQGVSSSTRSCQGRHHSHPRPYLLLSP